MSYKSFVRGSPGKAKSFGRVFSVVRVTDHLATSPRVEGGCKRLPSRSAGFSTWSRAVIRRTTRLRVRSVELITKVTGHSLKTAGSTRKSRAGARCTATPGGDVGASGAGRLPGKRERLRRSIKRESQAAAPTRIASLFRCGARGQAHRGRGTAGADDGFRAWHVRHPRRRHRGCRGGLRRPKGRTLLSTEKGRRADSGRAGGDHVFREYWPLGEGAL